MTIAARETVLVLAEYGWRNGGENSWLAVSTLLAARGWSFVVACPCPSEFSRHLEDGGFVTVDWRCHKLDGERKSQTQIRDELAALIDQLQPVLVHANSLATTRLAGPVTQVCHVPAIGCLRDIIKLSRRAVDDINQISALVAVSEATRAFHLAQGISADKSRVIYNGVDLSQFRPAAATGYLHHELELPESQRLILCIGQIGLRKGTDCVIRTFNELSKSFADIHLLLVGMRHSDKDESVAFEVHCRHLSEVAAAENRIHWLGRRTDVPRMFGEATLLLHGARQEPLGRVLLEAAASGCPFVATEAGGTREIVDGGELELLLCPVDSVVDMAAAAKELLNDKVLLGRTSQQLRRLAESRFDAPLCADQLSALYCRLIG